MERARAWTEAKSKERAQTSRVNSEAMDRVKVEAKTIVREKNNAVELSE